MLFLLQVWHAGGQQSRQSNFDMLDTLRPECRGTDQLARRKQCSKVMGPDNLTFCKEQPVARGKFSSGHQVQQRHHHGRKRVDARNDYHGKS